MYRKASANPEAGFTLIEALVAIAIVAAVLGAIGAVIGTTVKGTRSIDERLALSGLAETLLTTLPDRTLLKPGRQTGETAGHRWRIDVAPMKVSAEGAQDARFIPLSVTVRLQAPGGAATQLTTVRLVARPTE